MLPAQMVLLLKEDSVIAEVVEVILIVMVVYIHFYEGYILVDKVVRVEAGGMEVLWRRRWAL